LIDYCFLFLDNPQGGVEDFAWLKTNAPWIKAVFCNVRDYPVSQWELTVRPRATSNGFICGAWGRTTGDLGKFDPNIVDRIIATNDKWDSPGLINCEKEIDNNQSALQYIVKKIGSRPNYGLSVEPTPFHSLDWSIAQHLTIHPQIFPAEQHINYDPIDVRNLWWKHGVTCVYMTYGTYAGASPTDYELIAPYSLFTGDPIMATYEVAKWHPISIGFQGCKSTGGSMMVLTPQQAPWTERYDLPTSKSKSKGPTADAVKRAMGHLKLLPWGDFNQVWDLELWEIFADWKKSVGLPHDGVYGQKAWEKLRAATYKKDGKKLYALDPYARYLLQNEAGLLAESHDEEKVQAALTEWGNAIIANEPHIHYSQKRPVNVNQNPNVEFSSDCSGTIIQAFAYAKRKTDLRVPDPAKQKYTGYGNTDWYEDDHPKVTAPFRVGDLAHFENSRHVIMCIKAGDHKTAEWVSHGWEGGPSRVKLSTYNRYPRDFLFVVRPPLLEGK
jgi:hypothetical protein